MSAGNSVRNSLTSTRAGQSKPQSSRIILRDTTDDGQPTYGLAEGEDDEDGASSVVKPVGYRKQATGAVQKRLAQRRYKKYQLPQGDGPASSDDALPRTSQDAKDEDKQDPDANEGRVMGKKITRFEDLADESISKPKNKPEKKAGRKHKHRHGLHPSTALDEQYDMYYENQRGGTIFGRPYYSSRGLFQFDPPPWQSVSIENDYEKEPKSQQRLPTKAKVKRPYRIATLHESQNTVFNLPNLPDPSGEWVYASDWPKWYVDMSGDVDEEGWEYGFIFGGAHGWRGVRRFSWSWVRRRRWIRKRIRLDPKSALAIRSRVAANVDGASDAAGGHMLNADYFTIHGSERPAGHVHSRSLLSGSTSRYTEVSREDDDEDKTITDVNALRRAMLLATVDRQKLAALKNFLENAGDEVFYLPSVIPEVMALCLYQTTRRQVLQELQLVAADMRSRAEKANVSTEDDEDERAGPSPEAWRRQEEALEKSIEGARKSVKGLDFWTDALKAKETGEKLGVTTGLDEGEMPKRVEVNEKTAVPEIPKAEEEGIEIRRDLKGKQRAVPEE